MSCPKHQQQEAELRALGSEYADDDKFQDPFFRRCIGGHAPDVHCDNCRPKDSLIAKDHIHHLPSHCQNEPCTNCGRGTGSGSQCQGCADEIREVYTEVPVFNPFTGNMENMSYEKEAQLLDHLHGDTCNDPEEKGPGFEDHEYGDKCNPDHVLYEEGYCKDPRSPDKKGYCDPQYEDKGPGFEARLKNMEGKLPMSLLSPIFLEGIAAVLQHGSQKYASNMWRDDPMPFTAELDSIFRHLFAFLRCEDYDAPPPSGSGFLHLFNAGCRLMFLTERYFTHPELDDRYPAPGLEDEMFQEEVEVGAEAQYEYPLDGYQYHSRADLISEVDRLYHELKEERNA